MKLPLTFLLLLLLTACTITKRHVEPGYHVEWKRNFQREKATDVANKRNEIKPDVSETHTGISTMESETLDVASAIDSLNIQDANSSDQVSMVSNDRECLREIEPGLHSEPVIAPHKISDDEFPMEPEKQKVEPFTWAALAALFLAGMVVVLFFAASIIDYILIFALALGVVFIVFSIVSVTHIRRDPDKFKAKGLSWTLFGLSVAALLLVSLMMIIGSVSHLL